MVLNDEAVMNLTTPTRSGVKESIGEVGFVALPAWTGFYLREGVRLSDALDDALLGIPRFVGFLALGLLYWSVLGPSFSGGTEYKDSARLGHVCCADLGLFEDQNCITLEYQVKLAWYARNTGDTLRETLLAMQVSS